jgi:hypothetical protein
MLWLKREKSPGNSPSALIKINTWPMVLTAPIVRGLTSSLPSTSIESACWIDITFSSLIFIFIRVITTTTAKAIYFPYLKS